MTIDWQPRLAGSSGFLKYRFEDLYHFGGYVGFTVLFNAVLLGLMIWMFNSRWRVSSAGM
jgi:hypothetical protein